MDESAAASFAHNIVEQRFIARRGPVRWLMHALIMWGCVFSALISREASCGLLRVASCGFVVQLLLASRFCAV